MRGLGKKARQPVDRLFIASQLFQPVGLDLERVAFLPQSPILKIMDIRI